MKRQPSKPEPAARDGRDRLPARDALARLYTAAGAFRKLAPWEWMGDDYLIGVEEPASGTVGYCCVLGALGSMFGLAVYVGARGFYCFDRIASGELDLGNFDTAATQDSLLASFGARDELEPQDRRQIGTLGLKFRGRNEWPLFRSSRPGHAPWYLDAPEVDLLTVALEQMLDVCTRISDGQGFEPPELERPLLVRQRDPAGDVWNDTWQQLPQAPATEPPPQPERARIERVLQGTKRAAFTIETALSYLPTVVAEPGHRPCFPRIWLQADARTGVVGTGEMLEPDRTPAALQEAFLSAIEQDALIPAEIRTASDESFALLAPIADALGVRLRRVRSTPALDMARDALVEALQHHPMGRNELLLD
jgi:hypothetical protein